MSSISLSRSLISSRQIVHFLAIVDEGSLSRAARAVNITEPALSKSIRTLESYLQVMLFDRTPYGLVLTLQGKSLLHHARVIASELRHATEELAELNGASAGHVYVGAGPTFVQSVLPGAIASLRESHPKLRVTVEEGYVPDLVPRVLQGDLDFAILILEAVVAETELLPEALSQDEVVILSRTGHPLRARTDLSIADLAAADWVLPPREDKLSSTLAGLFRSEGLQPPIALVQSSSTNFARRLIARTDHLTFAPRALFLEELDAGSFVEYCDVVPPLYRTVGVVSRRHGIGSPAAKALMGKLRVLYRAPG